MFLWALKLTLCEDPPLRRPFLVPLKWGNTSDGHFVFRQPFWNCRSAGWKWGLCGDRFPAIIAKRFFPMGPSLSDRSGDGQNPIAKRFHCSTEWSLSEAPLYSGSDPSWTANLRRRCWGNPAWHLGHQPMVSPRVQICPLCYLTSTWNSSERLFSLGVLWEYAIMLKWSSYVHQQARELM